jgi:Lon protease-like protein
MPVRFQLPRSRGGSLTLDPVTVALPLFPLSTVLFPGLVLPLHVFEDRYRALVRHLMDLPEGAPREFGVIAIRRGWEVDLGAAGGAGKAGGAGTGSGPGTGGGAGRSGGAGTGSGAGTGGGEVALFEVGCTAELRQVTEHDDGRLDIVTVGRRRFHLDRLLPSATPYLQAEVSYLSDPDEGDGTAEELAPRALAIFRAYLALLHADGTTEVTEQLPEDATVLSHVIAATASLTIADRQALLAEPDTAARLRAELSLLHREVALLRQVRAVPVPLSELPVRPGPN